MRVLWKGVYLEKNDWFMMNWYEDCERRVISWLLQK